MRRWWQELGVRHLHAIYRKVHGRVCARWVAIRLARLQLVEWLGVVLLVPWQRSIVAHERRRLLLQLVVILAGVARRIGVIQN